MTAVASRAPASSAATAAAAEAAYGQNGRSPAAQSWEIEPLGFAAAPGVAAGSVETVPDLEAPQPRARPQLSPPEATDRVRVGSSAVNVRSGPGGSNGRLFVLAAGAEVRTTHAEDNWVRIEDEGGRTGWVYASYLVDAVLDGLPGAEDVAVAAAPSAPPAAEAPAETAPAETEPAASADSRTVLGQGVNVRAAPAGSGERLFALRGGVEVRVLEAQGGWLRVTDPEGRSGWVYSRFLSGS